MGPPASEFQITPVVLNNTINPGDGIRGTLGVGVRGIESSLDKFLSAVAESYWRIKSEQTLDSPCGNPSGCLKFPEILRSIYVFFFPVLCRNGLGPSTWLFTEVRAVAGSRTAIADAEAGRCYSRVAAGGKARAGDGFHWNSRAGFAYRRTTTRMSN